MPHRQQIELTVTEDGIEEITMSTPVDAFNQDLALEPLIDTPHLTDRTTLRFNESAWRPSDYEQRVSRIHRSPAGAKRNFTTPEKGGKRKLLLGLLATVVVAAVVFKTFFT